MVSEKAWASGMARLCACFPAANKNLSGEDIAIRDLAYHDAIAPMLSDEAWALAVLEATRTWEYPFALPPPQALLEAGIAAEQRPRAPHRPTNAERDENKRIAAEGVERCRLAYVNSLRARDGLPEVKELTTRSLDARVDGLVHALEAD